MAPNIADLFEHAVDLMPDRIALRYLDTSVTFAQVEERANRLASYLRERGVGKDDHVGVCARNRIEAVEAMLAAYKLRAVAINVNYRYKRNEFHYIFDNADLVALVYERRYSAEILPALAGLPALRTVVTIGDETDPVDGEVEFESALAEGSPERDFEQRSADDRYVLYTGGTTGMPKGVIWRHEDVWRPPNLVYH